LGRRRGYVDGCCNAIMKAPEVSHRNWERARGLTQIALGTADIDAGELSFADKLETLLDDGYDDRLEDMEDGEDYYHVEWGEDGVQIPIDPRGEMTHRPEVPDELAGRLDEWAAKTHPRLPVSSFDFDEKTGLLLDKAEEYYGELGCRVVAVEAQEQAQRLSEIMANSG
jgi:predicted transcriptional regulator